MRKLSSVLLLSAAVALGTAACTKPTGDAKTPSSSAPAPAAAKSPTVAIVNGKELGGDMFNVFLQAVTGKPAAEATPEQKQELLDQLITMELAAQSAEKEGLLKDPEVQARADLLHMQVLAQAASEKYSKSHPVSDSEVKAEYDAQVANMPKEYKARHILVDSKEAADDIIKQLKAGADFAKLAKEKSKDPGSAAKGGELDWFSASTMVKPFSEALTKLQKGQITEEPVQTQYGWHVIQLEDSRSPQPPAFDQVKQQVEMLAQRKKLQGYLDELRKNAQVQKKI